MTTTPFSTFVFWAAISLIVFTDVSDAFGQPQEAVFPPVDEASRDPDFLKFRNELLAFVRAHDADAVAARAHPDIKLSFGGSYGRETFHKMLVDNPTFGGITYWQELAHTLELGGVFEGSDNFCTPYIFCQEIPGCAGCDPYETLVAVSASAPIYAAPDADSEVVAISSYGIVAVIDTKHYPWSRVRLPVGDATSPQATLEGYVTAPDFRSPIDYRALFVKQADGMWLMTHFIAGD